MYDFQFAGFDRLCSELDASQLQERWLHYTRALSAIACSTGTSDQIAEKHGGVSTIGAMISNPLIYDARKKRHIIEKHMGIKGVAPDTRCKEYLSSVAAQFKGYMVLRKPNGNGLSPAGRNWTEPVTLSPADLDPFPSTYDSAHTTSTTQSTCSSGGAAQTFIAELEGDSCHCVSPSCSVELEGNSSYIPSPISATGSPIFEADGEPDHASVALCPTTSSDLEGDYTFDTLVKSMDKAQVSEIEYELEQAIREMDDTTSRFEDTVNKRLSRVIHVDNARSRVRDSQYSFDDTRTTINQASMAPLRSPRSFSGGLHLIQVSSHTNSHKHSPKGMEPCNEEAELPSPTGTLPPAYSETDATAAFKTWTPSPQPSLPSPTISGHHESNEKHPVAADYFCDPQGASLAHTESTSSRTSQRLIMSDPYALELKVEDVAISPIVDSFPEPTPDEHWTPTISPAASFAESTTSTLSTAGSRVLSAHYGMKKVGYFGLEPAAKLAVGGSLLLMGVRPSVQRKMLDKAKSRIGIPDRPGKVDEDDDDYLDYR
ncbi:unnamed protein product [Discula destructiva]